jgi:hypothetical protein
MVIVVDDEDRENEGDRTIAAEKITPQAINFMAQYGRGLICLAMTPEHLDALKIPLMVPHNSSRFETAFCVSIEAADRASTVLTAINPATRPSDLIRPGHMSNKPALLCPKADKGFWGGQRRGGILRLVVLIVFDLPIGQHALMQYSRNQYASALLTVKHDVLAMLQTTQARANLITESA